MVRKFRPTGIAQAVELSMQNPVVARLRDHAPPWLEAVQAIPPAQVLIRTVPVAHRAPNPKMKKPRRTYRPQRIVYEEDELRQTFFRDHPWELARPRVLVEQDGKDAQRHDWSRGLLQPGMPLCGECVVQRQLWMMNNGMPKDKAYDAARREFYDLRHREEVERRVAQEEAAAVGAYFGKNALQAGMELEDKTYEHWKGWAARQTAKIEAERSRAYVDFSSDAGSKDGTTGTAAAAAA